MAVVGNATVVVRAVADQFRKDLRKTFSAAAVDADAGGESAGRRYGKRFSDVLGKTLDGNALLRKMVREIEGAGDGSGLTFGQRFGRRVEDTIGPGFARSMDRVIRASSISGDHAGSGFFNSFLRRGQRGLLDLERNATSAGDGIGNTLRGAFSFQVPDFGGVLLIKITALIPLIGVLGGGLAALVGSLTAVAAVAAFAAGSLAILATGVVGLIGALGAGILAFGGIGKAVSALGAEQADAGKSALASAKAQKAAARAIEEAKRRVIQAEKDLKRAREDAALGAQNAARNVESAERRLVDAQKAAKRAQEDLTRARVDAAHRLVDLQLSLRGSVLGEEQATLNLQRAQENYQRVINDGSASAIDRQQAILDLEQAELALDEAKQRRQDVTLETEKANKAGIEGSDQVVAAKDNINDANQSLRDSEQALADARRDQARQAVDAAERIASAQQNVRDAIQAVSDAQASAAETARSMASAQATAAAALAKLSPEARKFAKFLFSLKPQIAGLREAAGKELFPALTTSIKTIVNDFFPTLKTTLQSMGAALGQFTLQLSAAFSNKNFQNNLTQVTGALVSDFGLAGQAAGNFMRGLVGLARAAEPAFARFLTFIEKITGSFARKFEGEENVSRMTKLINRMADAAALIGSVLFQAGRVIKNVFVAAFEPGIGLTEDMATSLKKTADSIAPGTKKFERLRQFFKDVIPPTKAVMRFLGELGKQFLLLGQDKNGKLSETFDKLRDVLPKVGNAIVTFTTQVAPKFVDVLGEIVDIFQRVVNSNAFGVFIGTIELISKGIKGLFSVLDVLGLDKFAGALLGVAAAMKVLGKATGVKINLRNLTQGAPDATGARPRSRGQALKRAGAGVAVASAAVAIAPALLKGDFKKAASNLGSLVTDNLTPILFLAGPQLVGALKKGMEKAGPALGGAAKKLGGFIKNRIAQSAASGGDAGFIDFSKIFKGTKEAEGGAAKVGKLSGALKKLKSLGPVSKAVRGLGLAFTFMTGPVGLIILGVAALAAGLIYAYKHSEKFRNFVNALGKVVQKVFSAIGDVVGKVFTFVKKHFDIILFALGPFGIAIGLIVQVFKNWDKIREIVGKVIGAVVDFFVKLPGRILDAIRGIGTTVGNFLRGAFNFVRNVFVAAITGYVDFWLKLPGRIVNALGNLGSRVGDVFRRAFGGLSGIVSGIIDRVIDLFRGIPGRLAALGTTLLNAGKSIGTFLLRGVTATLGAVTELVKAPIRVVLDAIRGVFKALSSLQLKVPNWVPLIGNKSFGFPDISSIVPKLAMGATVKPRPGGTLALLAEAGRAESVVDTGLINRRLRNDELGSSRIVDELRKIEALLEQLRTLNGIQIHAPITVPNDKPSENAREVARNLRNLTFELGG